MRKEFTEVGREPCKIMTVEEYAGCYRQLPNHWAEVRQSICGEPDSMEVSIYWEDCDESM